MRRARRELRQQNRGDDEGDAVAQIASDHGPAASSVVDEEDAAELSDDGDDGADALVFEGVGAGDADLLENFRTSIVSVFS